MDKGPGLSSPPLSLCPNVQQSVWFVGDTQFNHMSLDEQIYDFIKIS